MSRGKKWISSRTPTEHRLYVEELDRKQRERSANGKAVPIQTKRNKTAHKPAHGVIKRAKLYCVERYTQE